MKRGRKALVDSPVEKSLSLPGSVVAEVELRLYDPATQKVKYGAFAQLVEALLRQWLSQGGPNVPQSAGIGTNNPPPGPAPINNAGQNP